MSFDATFHLISVALRNLVLVHFVFSKLFANQLEICPRLLKLIPHSFIHKLFYFGCPWQMRANCDSNRFGKKFLISLIRSLAPHQ